VLLGIRQLKRVVSADSDSHRNFRYDTSPSLPQSAIGMLDIEDKSLELCTVYILQHSAQGASDEVRKLNTENKRMIALFCEGHVCDDNPLCKLLQAGELLTTWDAEYAHDILCEVIWGTIPVVDDE
jgi:hypothetical protein